MRNNIYFTIVFIAIVLVGGCIQQTETQIEEEVKEQPTEGNKTETKKETEVTTFQEFSLTENIYPGYFEPEEITVKKGVLVKLHISSKQYEHINRISILPWVESSDVVVPGKPITIEFTPDKVGEFKIRNIGHGFEARLTVVE